MYAIWDRNVATKADANRTANAKRNIQMFQREMIVQGRDAQSLTITVRTVEHVDLVVFRFIGFRTELSQQELVRD